MSRLEKRLEQLEAKKGTDACVFVFAPDFPEGHEADDPEAFYRKMAFEIYGHSNYHFWLHLGQDCSGPHFSYEPDLKAFFARVAANTDRVGVKRSNPKVEKQRDKLADFIDALLLSEESKERRNSKEKTGN